MALVTLREVLQDAARKGYAVGAFNANNLEYVQGIVDAAEAEAAPVIVQASPGAIAYMGLAYIAAVGQVAARANVPVVIHLDHGLDIAVVERCLREGFTSVMYDGSALGFEENVAVTARVVALARSAGASAEGELGRVPAADREWTAAELERLMTDPEQAAEFVARTGVDALAVAVGSVHRMRRQAQQIDVERVSRLRRATGVPLVLHGSSGVTDDSLVAAVKAGVAKVNIATALNLAFTGALSQAVRSHPDEIDPRKLLGPAREAVARAAAAKMRLLGCSGRAGGRAGGVAG
ncbi:MAG: class II fructose-bisphosphate aldolase [Acetobacteraceae bacterium]|nr:class II fructose-bisphosphate aldolase [Acetobacteraceae bacterium]